jgi:CBS domain-containing protein
MSLIYVSHRTVLINRFKGVISEHDLIAAQANNPGVLIKEIKRSQNPKELKQIRERLTDLIQTSKTYRCHMYSILLVKLI